MKLNLVLVCFVIILSKNVLGQQLPQYTQYMYNTSTINPAYTGTEGFSSVALTHRSQWVGIDGAPTTQLLNANFYSNRSRLHLGFTAYMDRLGPLTSGNLSLNLAYQVPISNTYNLSFGLAAIANTIDVDWNKLHPYTISDPFLAQGLDNSIEPNVGVGVFLFSEKSYFGMSAPNLLQTDRYEEEGIEISVYTEKPHFNFIGGSVFDLNRDLLFKPAFWVRAVSGAPIQVDVSANFMFNESFTLGTSYRWGDSVSALAGFNISTNLMIGYAYDFGLSELARVSSGSHEIFIKFSLGSSGNYRNSRFF